MQDSLTGPPCGNGDAISWTLVLTLNPQKVERWQNLLQDIVSEVEANEPGTLNYQWSISEDKKSAQVYERYANAESAIKHMANFAKKFGTPFFDPVVTKHLLVYGDPGEEVRNHIKEYHPKYQSPVMGLNRDLG